MNKDDIRAQWLAKAQERTSGCPLMNDRTKADLTEIEGEEVTLEDAYPLTGDDGNYYCFTVKEEPELFFLSCKSITNILEDATKLADYAGIMISDVIKDTVIKLGTAKKTKKGHSFRPVEIVTK